MIYNALICRVINNYLDMPIKAKKKLSEIYRLAELEKQEDTVAVPFKILNNETAFRMYCIKYGNKNGFNVSVRKGESNFYVTRIN